MNDMLAALGPVWRDLPDGRLEQIYKTWRDRPAMVAAKAKIVAAFLPEYREPPARSVLDVSCGAGIFLEIMRHYGHAIMGMEVQHFDYLESQGISYVGHNASTLPWPFPDQSVDLVTCMASISLYDQPWEVTLAEMFRIARQTVLVIANRGPHLDRNAGTILGWRPAGWRMVIARGAVCKWVRA